MQRHGSADGGYECAYEWRIVSYAMHSHAKLNAKAGGKLLYYIPSIDIPTVRLNKRGFDGGSSEACRRSCSLVQPAATSNYNRDSSESRGEITLD